MKHIGVFDRLVSKIASKWFRLNTASSSKYVMIKNSRTTTKIPDAATTATEPATTDGGNSSSSKLVLYDFEASPWCRLVREYLTMFNMSVHIRPCPRETLFYGEGRFSNTKSRFRPEAMKVFKRSHYYSHHHHHHNSNNNKNENEVVLLPPPTLTFPLLVDTVTTITPNNNNTNHHHHQTRNKIMDINSNKNNNVNNDHHDIHNNSITKIKKESNTTTTTTTTNTTKTTTTTTTITVVWQSYDILVYLWEKYSSTHGKTTTTKNDSHNNKEKKESDNNNKILSLHHNPIRAAWKNHRPDKIVNSSMLPFPIRFLLLAGPSYLRPWPRCGLMLYPSLWHYKKNRQEANDKNNSNSNNDEEQQQLVLYNSYEGCPQTRLVREVLCSLQLPYLSVPSSLPPMKATTTEAEYNDDHDVVSDIDVDNIKHNDNHDNVPILIVIDDHGEGNSNADNDDDETKTKTKIIFGSENIVKYLLDVYYYHDEDKQQQQQQQPSWFDSIIMQDSEPELGDNKNGGHSFSVGIYMAFMKGRRLFVPEAMLATEEEEKGKEDKKENEI